MNNVCPICFYYGEFDSTEETPTPLKRYEAICPLCRSKETARLLRLILTQLHDPLSLKSQTCRHFSPVPPEISEVFFRNYEMVNTEGDDLEVDLQNAPFFPSVDVTIAIHVLEHIPDDDSAIAAIANTTRLMAILPVPNFYNEMKELDTPDAHGHVRQTTEEYYNRLDNYFRKVVRVRSTDYSTIYQTQILMIDGPIYEEVFPLCFV